jgi:hypothetical protein
MRIAASDHCGIDLCCTAAPEHAELVPVRIEIASALADAEMPDIGSRACQRSVGIVSSMIPKSVLVFAADHAQK